MMDTVEYLSAQRNLARQALVNSLRDSKEWVQSGTMARQATRRYPWPIIGASAAGGFVLGTQLAGLLASESERSQKGEPASERSQQHASTIGTIVNLARSVGLV
jgi:hypothetical protein